jgi:hypothetical protein
MTHPRTGWIIIPIYLDGSHYLEMVLDPGSPASAINPLVERELRTLDAVGGPQEPRFDLRLSGVTAQGQQLPDFDVVLLPRLARLSALQIKVDGLLGLNFLNSFAAICYSVDQRRLVLTPRPTASAGA